MTFEEARAVFDEQVEVRYDGMIFDRCKIDIPEERHVQCGEIDREMKKGGEKE